MFSFLVFALPVLSGVTREYLWMATLTRKAPDCVMRSGLAINGMSPGPEIRANPGDRIRVTFRNQASTGPLRIHWHGIKIHNNWYEGGSETMCPIAYGDTFTYDFKIPDDHVVGTFWWHAHEGGVSMEGVYGAFIIEHPSG